jgi:hypothetical protein
MAAQINLTTAHEVALEDFAAGDPRVMAHNSLVSFKEEESVFEVPYLGKLYRLTYPGGQVSGTDGGTEVPLAVKIIILHYLTQAGPEPLEGTRISYKELPNGFVYATPFANRNIRPLVSIFAGNPDKLKEAAAQLGGREVELGDVAVEIFVLPKVPVTFVLWFGDDEFPASGNVLFDSAAGNHLHTEDYALIPGLAIWDMKRLAGL